MKTMTVIPAEDVVVNGVAYKTELVNGVHRFVENEAVAFFVEMNGEVLNDLAVAVVEKKVRLEDYIAFYTMHGMSIGGFLDSITSIIAMNDHIFPGKLEDYFVIENPRWDD